MKYSEHQQKVSEMIEQLPEFSNEPELIGFVCELGRQALRKHSDGTMELMPRYKIMMTRNTWAFKSD